MCNDMYCKSQAFDLFRHLYGINAIPEQMPEEWENVRQIAHEESLLKDD